MRWISARNAVWFLLTVLLAAASVAAQQSTSSDDAKAKALVQSKCTVCHGIESLATQNLDKAGWKNLVESMRRMGADLKDDEATLVTDYLAKTYATDTEAETKRLVEGSCGSCHGMDVVASAQKTKEEWA